MSLVKLDMDIVIFFSSNLGSLCMRFCKEKKCKIVMCRYGKIFKFLIGKICKGFSEKFLIEMFKWL